MTFATGGIPRAGPRQVRARPVALVSDDSEETVAILRYSCKCFAELGVTSSDLAQGQISPPLWSLGNQYHFKP